MTNSPLDEALCAVRDTLVQFAQWGCRGFDCRDGTLAILDRWSRPHTAEPAPRVPNVPAATVGPTATCGSAAPDDLERIRAELADCRRCALGDHRTHVVFGEGDRRARVLFVGEGPGREEDRTGRPFVGEAGQLLTRIIAAMGLDREQVYICNVVKCRPPGNRNPAPEEIQTCRPFLDRQIVAVAPMVICALGTFAARTLLGTDLPISQLRGRFHDYQGIKVMPTFHPAYLLRNPEQKRSVWEDVQKIMALLRIPQ